MLALSSKVLDRLPLPRWPWPFQSGPIVGNYDGHDVEWSGSGEYGLRRASGTEYCSWAAVPVPECHSDHWRRSTMTLSVRYIRQEDIDDLNPDRLAEWDNWVQA